MAPHSAGGEPLPGHAVEPRRGTGADPGPEPPVGQRAVQEIRERGDLGGDATYELLRRAFWTAARRVPGGVVTDDGASESAEDSFHRFLLAKLTSLPADLALKDSDEDITKLVYAVAHRWLQDRSRSKTDHGSHRHTLERLMRRERAFHQRPGSTTLWGLAGATSIYGGEDTTLRRAAAGVTGIRPGRRGNDEQRDSLAPGPDLSRLLHAVLAAAGGYVAISTLTYVVEHRLRAFAPRIESIEGPTTAHDERRGDPVRPVPEQLVSHDAESSGREPSVELVTVLWQALSDQERRVVTLLGDIPAIRAELGVGRSQANVINRRLQARLEHVDGTDAEPALVLELLSGLCERERRRTVSDSVRQGQTGHPGRSARAAGGSVSAPSGAPPLRPPPPQSQPKPLMNSPVQPPTKSPMQQQGAADV